ncbi:MAG TPA: anti-sigma factor [Egicoccus sp.]|nr:anti-sigma factor [Egicoccus sp.]HSK22774.1 anti-sigma factor [Egicoccus sp.]
MGSQHERYEKLAVGHVLGGLDATESSDFRSHLLGCRDCRLRVAELRDLAADLAAAERDERARALVRTEVARRDESDEEPAPGSRLGIRHVTLAVLVVMVLAVGMGFWNLHLRTAAAGYAQAASYRGDTLRVLAEGQAVAAEVEGEVVARVVVDDDEIGFTVSRLPELAEGERLEVWLTTADGPVRALAPVQARHVTEGDVAGHLDRAGAEELLITRERGPVRDTPGSQVLVRADLDAPV